MARENPLDRLTPKRRAFVQAYRGPAQGNATAAARSAGYAHPGAEGHRLLKNAEVVAAIDQLAAPAERAAVADREELEGTLTAWLRDPESPRGERRKALEILAKMRGYSVRRVEKSVAISSSTPDRFVGRSTDELIAFLRTGRFSERTSTT